MTKGAAVGMIVGLIEESFITYFFFKIVLTWEIVRISEVSVLYICIYIYIYIYELLYVNNVNGLIWPRSCLERITIARNSKG